MTMFEYHYGSLDELWCSARETPHFRKRYRELHVTETELDEIWFHGIWTIGTDRSGQRHIRINHGRWEIHAETALFDTVLITIIYRWNDLAA